MQENRDSDRFPKIVIPAQAVVIPAQAVVIPAKAVVIPAKAGICFLDSHFRGNDGKFGDDKRERGNDEE